MNPSLLISASGPTPPPRRTGSPSAFTDNNGRFVLAAVPAGPTFLSVTKAGFAKTTFGARRPGIPPIAVDVPRGGRIDAIEIRMAKSGAIAGRIVERGVAG